jgi:hypothetical protein
MPPEPIDEDEEDPVTVPVGRLSSIIELCNEAETYPRSTKRVDQMWDWARVCAQWSTTEQDINASGVVPRLVTFLDPNNSARLNNKMIPKALREDMLILPPQVAIRRL